MHAIVRVFAKVTRQKIHIDLVGYTKEKDSMWGDGICRVEDLAEEIQQDFEQRPKKPHKQVFVQKGTSRATDSVGRERTEQEKVRGRSSAETHSTWGVSILGLRDCAPRPLRKRKYWWGV